MKKYRIKNRKRFFIANLLFVIAILVILELLMVANADAIFDSLANASTTGCFH